MKIVHTIKYKPNKFPATHTFNARADVTPVARESFEETLCSVLTKKITHAPLHNHALHGESLYGKLCVALIP